MMDMISRTVVLMMALAGLLAGCAGEQIIDRGGPGPNAVVTDRSRWVLSGDFADPARAADDNVSTVAVSGEGPASFLQIDLGKVCVFNLIIVDHGPDRAMDVPGRIAVQMSSDGKTWTTEHVAPGTRRITYIPLVGPRLARYVRLQTQTPGPGPWTVAEVYFQ